MKKEIMVVKGRRMETMWLYCRKKEDVFSLTRYPLHRFDDDNDEFRSFEMLRTDDFCNGIKKY